MLRLISKALVALALLGGPALAQTFTLPELGLQNSGTCRQLATRNRTSGAMVALGCVDTASGSWKPLGDGSSLSVSAPSASAPAGTLSSILSGGTVLPRLNMQTLLFNGAPSLSHIPTGNPIISNASQVLQTFTSAPDTREIGASLGMTATTGAQHSGDGTLGNGDKITLYTGMVMKNGSFNGWSQNPLLEISAGNTSFGGAWIIEADVNNLQQDVGNAAGPSGLSDKHVWGIQTVSGGAEGQAKHNTAAFSTFSLTQSGRFNRGYLCQTQSVVLSCFEDHSTAAASFQDWGNHVVSFDLSNATTSVGAMRLKNGMPIVARSAANTSDVPLLYNTAGTTVLNAESNISLPKPTTAYASLTVTPGTNPASTGQPAGTFAGTIYNNTNASGQNGLLVKSNFATAASTIFEAGTDVVSGAYAPAVQIKGDRKLYLWDGTTMTAVAIGPAGSGPGGTGRALYLP